MKTLSFFIVGFIFAIGLEISGMTNPEKIKGFLDVTGTWDPSLGFVMIGAVLFHFISYRLITQRESPLFEKNWHIPNSRKITPALVIGSILFGLGWGLGGYCPGPAVTSLASIDNKTTLFVLSMLTGMFIVKQWKKN